MEEFKCLICGKIFKSKVGLGTHIAQYERVPMEKNNVLVLKSSEVRDKNILRNILIKEKLL